MILGIGTDIVSIARIGQTLEKQAARFLDRCFTDAERAYVEARPALRAAGYAKRWAAKEACAKALGLGIRGDITLRDIAVVNDDAGRPGLVLSGGAAARLLALVPEGMTSRIHLSLSDEAQTALAFVVLEAL